MMTTSARTPINAKCVEDFLREKGADAGSRTLYFYSANVFFEKLRIKLGKPKHCQGGGGGDSGLR
jgi:hypothetical protein